MRRSTGFAAGVAAGVLALAACGHATEDVAIVAPKHDQPRAVPGVPHGGFINHVAITDQADAALSVDTIGELRLWPSLDGKHQPIPFEVGAATEMVLGHAGDDLLATVVDQAGAARMFRVGRDGAIHARIQLPGDTAIEQVVAIEDGVLVVRIDQSIERYDAGGKLRARLVAGAGERIGAIAARRGSAAVLITTAVEPVEPVEEKPKAPMSRRELDKPLPPIVVHAPIATAMRWVVLTDGLRWGTSIKLDDAIDARVLALSPNHRRIAVLDSRMNTVEVLDLDPLPRQVVGGPSLQMFPTGTSTLGFTDDDHLAVSASSIQWWTPPATKPDRDPWAIEPAPANDMAAGGDGGAVGDALVVSGFGASLALTDYHTTHYLGWKYLGNGNLMAIGNHVGVAASNTHVLWLDDALAKQSDTDLTSLSAQYAVFVDSHHAAIERIRDGKYAVELVDSEHLDKPVSIGTYAYVERLEYDSEMHVLVVGSNGQLQRFAVDVDHTSVTELPAIKSLAASAQSVRMLDPARAKGAIALVVTYEDDGQHVTVYTQTGSKLRAGKNVAVHGNLLATDVTGLVYARLETEPTQLVTLRDGRVETKFPPELVVDSVVTNHALNAIATLHGTEITVLDANGTQRWKQTLWSAVQVMFTPDDKRLLVRTSGGLVELDARTGERVAMACGFEFGIDDKAPQVNALGVMPVCEDGP